MEELYKLYGRYMIELEILNNKILEIKKMIAEEFKKPKEEKVNG